MKEVNPRKKKVDAICTKIALFMVQETFNDENEVQKLLTTAIYYLDKASEMMVENDLNIEKEKKSEEKT